MSKTYRVSLQKEQLVFSSAHFITFNGNVCESLHGHNYGLRCEVFGPLDENGYVVDFIALRDALLEISGRLDHKMLLAEHHGTIKVEHDSENDEYLVRFEDRRWVFPADNCVLLPIQNTTAELLAEWIGRELIRMTFEKFGSTIERLLVSVDENHGQWAVYYFHRT